MTLLGKVFIALLLVFSVLFFAFALAVNASHQNWRTAVTDPQNGYLAQISVLTKNVEELKSSLAQAQLQLAEEQAARRVTLSALQTQLDRERKLLAELTREKLELQSSNTELNQTANANTKENERLIQENTEIKERIDNVLEDRNGQRSLVIQKQDELNSLQVIADTIESRRAELLAANTLTQAQLDSARSALAANGIEEDPDDVAPSNLRGVVTAVGQNGLVEVSIGKDDGLRVGHELEIFRGARYLGRILIEDVDFDKSIGRTLRDFRRGYIQLKDNVVPTL